MKGMFLLFSLDAEYFFNDTDAAPARKTLKRPFQYKDKIRNNQTYSNRLGLCI